MKTGKPLSKDVRATRTNKQCVQNINRSIRSDCGGKNKIQYIMDKIGCNEAMAEKVARLLDDQIEGIRKRTSHDREELLRRFDHEDEMETLVSTRAEWKPKSLVILGFEDVDSAVSFYDNSSVKSYRGVYGAQLHKDAKPFILLQKYGRIVIDD